MFIQLDAYMLLVEQDWDAMSVEDQDRAAEYCRYGYPL